MSSTTVLLPFRAVRRMLDRAERALRPSPSAPMAEDRTKTATIDVDADSSTTTRELLLPAMTDEPPAARASRQAQDYLARRRRRLNRQLESR